MADTRNCIKRIAKAIGRDLTDEEIHGIFERVHKAALDIKAGRKELADVSMGKPRALTQVREDLSQVEGGLDTGDSLIRKAAERAAKELEHEAFKTHQRAMLQLTVMGTRQADVARLEAQGVAPLEAVDKLIARDYGPDVNIQSLEQLATGYNRYFNRRLQATWDALGFDYLGFFQDQAKLLDLVRALRGDVNTTPEARKGAKAFHEVAEEARQLFNSYGGDIGRLDDWGMPQHHSQELVAMAGREQWVDFILPKLDRTRYVDDLEQPWSDAELREFLGHAWDTIATNGHATRKPGQRGAGSVARRHAEHRQIHFKDAEATIDYWKQFGDRTLLDILSGHVDTLARDIAFVEYWGPNPNTTYQTIRDEALTKAAIADPVRTTEHEGRAVKLDELYNYSAGRVKPTYNAKVRSIADGIAHLNIAGKLGGAMFASLYGDKVMMEAVAHLNHLPLMQRWTTELSLLNPAAAEDRRMIMRQGLMLGQIRSGLQRFYEGLGRSGFTARLANAVMRVTGMQAINEIRLGAFGTELYSAIGHEISAGKRFTDLASSDVRLLRHWGITEVDWRTWQLAKRERIRFTAGHHLDDVLTPDSISLIPDDALRQAGIIGAVDGPEAADAARRNAIVKLLGAVNTESEFAVVHAGWRERAQFYGEQQRGTVKGEIMRSVLQFKSFPWAYLQRGMDAVANSPTPAGKAMMVGYLLMGSALAGSMIMQTREVLSGKDPLAMANEDWYKFWGKAFLQGGALGIYGDFLYGVNQTRYGSGPLEAIAGPSLGPLLSIGVVQPMTAIKQQIEGKESHFIARQIAQAKGFIPGNNIWYTKAATEHLLWHQVMESLSPGYTQSIRSRTRHEYGQEWWWQPGDIVPERGPNLEAALER